MKSALCDQLGIDVPVFAFSHCRDVVVEVCKAGGIGVFGAVGYTPEQVKAELDWIDERVGDRPYGIDVIMPTRDLAQDVPDLNSLIPEEHKGWVEHVMQRYGIAPLPDDDGDSGAHGITGDQIGWQHDIARQLLEEGFRHPNCKVMVNALGTPPDDIMLECRQRGILVGALAGRLKHALSHKAGGVDFIIAQGHEAGGHTGEVTTMVLVPQVVDAVAPTPVLAAGGIGSGRQAAAAMALGAQGVWCGSIWLTSPESEVEPLPKSKLLKASSEDTIRTRMLSGKPARMLKSTWTEAWDEPDCPGFLPMPLQGMLVMEANHRISRAQNEELAFYPTGQVVGQMNQEKDCRTIMYELLEEYADTIERLHGDLHAGAVGEQI